jgi:two-component system, NtrC family, response regulator AtoC
VTEHKPFDGDMPGTLIVDPAPNDAWQIIVVFGGERVEHRLEAPCALTIGRDPENTIAVHHPSISRKHARVTIQEGAVIEDLGSSNGTRVDGVRLAPHQVSHFRSGTLVELGDVLLMVREPQRAADTPAPLHGVSGNMVKVMELVSAAARTTMNVWLSGPPGCGKSWCAERIRQTSPRASLPLASLEMGPQTTTAELFGADARTPGALEAAGDGIVLLRRIDTLARELQPSLAKVLANKTIVRLDGSTATLRARVLSTAVEAAAACRRRGTFDTVLLDQLVGITIAVPGLIDRRGEIRYLARQFAYDAGGCTISEPAFGQLMLYDWPNNVRELAEVVRLASATARHAVILPDDIRLNSPEGQPTGRAAEAAAERKRIMTALELCAGNQTKAAKVLGIARRTMVNRMRELAIPGPRRGTPDT